MTGWTGLEWVVVVGMLWLYGLISALLGAAWVASANHRHRADRIEREHHQRRAWRARKEEQCR